MARKQQPPPVAEKPVTERVGRECVHDDFESAVLGNRRRITVRLPPGYDRAWSRCYPVVYMHDGQNLFDADRATHGVSWRAGEISDRLVQDGRIRPVILVGIDSTDDRLDEYSPFPDAEQEAGGDGEDYARFVLDELKPFIDRQYRTMPGRDTTAVAGSSMGGLISLAMARKHNERIGLCGAMSPALWWAQGRLLDEMGKNFDWMRRMRFWLCMGTREGGRRSQVHVSPYIELTRRLIDIFDQAYMVPGRHYLYQEVAGAEHSEADWSARFDKVLLYLFGQ